MRQDWSLQAVFQHRKTCQSHCKLSTGRVMSPNDTMPEHAAASWPLSIYRHGTAHLESIDMSLPSETSAPWVSTSQIGAYLQQLTWANANERSSPVPIPPGFSQNLVQDCHHLTHRILEAYRSPHSLYFYHFLSPLIDSSG